MDYWIRWYNYWRNEEPELIGDPNGFSEDGRPYNAFGFWVTKMNSKILRDMGL